MLLLLWAVPALSGLVPTPFGERPAECVLTLPHGATVQQPDLSMTSEAVAVTRTVHDICHTTELP